MSETSKSGEADYTLRLVAEVDKSKPLPRENSDVPKIPIELAKEMREAADFEQLKACWRKVGEIYGFDQHDFQYFQRRIPKDSYTTFQSTPLSYLCQLCRNFLRPESECDTVLKDLKRDGLLSTVEQLGFPLEFLFHTVRMGAIKGLEKRATRSPHNALNIPPDTILEREIEQGEHNIQPWGNFDGFSWADAHLSLLEIERKADDKKLKDLGKKLERAQKETQQELLLAKITSNMNPSFALSREEAALLRPGWEAKLRFWKAVFESSEFRQATALKTFLEKHGDEEITHELFEQFKTVYMASISEESTIHPKGRLRNYGTHVPFEVLDPSSGWFFVCIKCVRPPITFKELIGNIHSNMGDWGPDYVTNPRTAYDY